MTAARSPSAFGELLRRKRHDARLTQEELAARSGLAARTISDLERGLVAAPRWDTVRQLVSGLGLHGPDRVSFEEAARQGAVDPLPVAPDDVRTSQAARQTLPRDIGSFTGRADELRELLAAVAGSAGIVAIHAIGGMAGVGKTAFAVRAAHELASRFPDGQAFVQLHGHTPGLRPVEASDALASLLMTAGIPAQRIPPGLAPRAALWRDHVAGKRMLLLLDDAVSSDQVRPLLPGNRNCLVLLTSRRHLIALDDSRAISLNPLRGGEAAELLVRLAGRPGLGADDVAVAEIVRLCGNLPLAVGLLARQLHHHPAWTCARLAADLRAARNRLDLMHAENLSVTAAFDLTYQDLSDRQQLLFRRLGLHPGPDIDEYAAAALGGTDLPTARRDLEAIYDQYLLTELTQRRYRMHDLIREHARAMAVLADSDSDRAQAIDRLLDYYQRAAQAADRLLSRYTRPGNGPAIESATSAARGPATGIGSQPGLLAAATIPELHDDIQALAWARAERASLMACLDYATQTGQHDKVVALTAAMAPLLRNDGPWTEAIICHRAAVKAARHLGDQFGESAALADLGDLLKLTGDDSGATQSLEDALDLSRAIGDLFGQASAMTDLASLRANTWDFSGAIDWAANAERICQDLGDKLGQARALSYLGYAHNLAGDYRGALRPLEDALVLYRDLGNRLGHGSVLNYLALAWHGIGDFQQAADMLEAALAIHRELPNRHGQAAVLVDLARLRRETGNYGGATQALEAAQEILHEIGSPRLLGQACNEMGAVHRARGDVAMATTCHEQALDLGRKVVSPWLEACSIAGLGRCAAAAGRAADARSSLELALAIFRQLGVPEAGAVAAELEALATAGTDDGPRLS